jgi:predicted nucleic acid-binding protein
MVKVLLDTNVLIDFLRGIPAAQAELARHDDAAISVITWMEVLVGAPPALEQSTRDFLNDFRLIELDQKVADRAVGIRRDHRLKLPDAIIWSSAQVHARLLITRDTKGFPADDPGVRVPYTV